LRLAYHHVKSLTWADAEVLLRGPGRVFRYRVIPPTQLGRQHVGDWVEVFIHDGRQLHLCAARLITHMQFARIYVYVIDRLTVKRNDLHLESRSIRWCTHQRAQHNLPPFPEARNEPHEAAHEWPLGLVMAGAVEIRSTLYLIFYVY
jgi:hypothetical protein